jgi:hypothetical protein
MNLGRCKLSHGERLLSALLPSSQKTVLRTVGITTASLRTIFVIIAIYSRSSSGY